MRLSRWCHPFERDGVVALFHTLTLQVAYLASADFAAITRQIAVNGAPDDPDVSEGLRSLGMLVDADADDDALFAQTYAALRSAISLELLYLLVTDGCNLRCTYCFEETPGVASDFRTTRMTHETVRASLDLFAAMTARHGNPAMKKVVHLYGGEPLVNRHAVYETVRYVAELKERGALPGSTVVTMVTNGVLLTEADARLFAQHGVTVGLSVDGPRQVTERYRVAKRPGVPVMDKITSAFRMLRAHGVEVGLSVTLTPEAIARFDEVLDFFTEGEFAQAQGISLNLLHFTPHLALPEDYYRRAVECQIVAFQRFRARGFYEERVMRKARAFVDQRPMYADCGVVGNQLVIAPDGRIGVCQDFVKPRTYFPASVYDDNHDDLLERLFGEWRERSPFTMPACRACPALGICGGGCPASVELKHGDRFLRDERACAHSQRTLEWLLWDAFENQRAATG